MPLIEGLGDEVTQFLLAVSLIVIAIAAWLSTRIPDAAPVRAVVYVEQSESRPPEVQPQIVLNNTPVVLDPEEANKSDDDTSSETTEVDLLDADIQPEVLPSSPNEMSDDVSVIRNRRLAFFNSESQNDSRNLNPSSDCTSGSPTVTVDSGTVQFEETAENPLSPGPHADPLSSPSIKIRLKYLNDDLKLVEGNLLEQVGEFKKRHFSLELSGRKLVRLIFNGQVLGQESWTLGHYGLHDNCVVHCLVHPIQPSATPPPSPTATRRSSPTSSTLVLNPFNMLFATLTVILALAWYGRYQYSQLYTATTTVALVGITGIFTVSLIGIYMPEPLPLNNDRNR